MKRLRLKSPKFEDASIEIPVEASFLDKPLQGLICSARGDEYKIENNIIRLDTGNNWKLTLAQRTNFWKPSASNYEHLWRVNALSYLSGESFPIEKEKELLLEWTEPQENDLVLDAGCSTALYGRFLLQKESSIGLYAVDFSPYMLEEARKALLAEQHNAYLICANVEQLPFWAASFDLAVCGGTLNEFADPMRALYEIRRVMTRGGRVFMMYLTESTSFYIRTLQRGAAAGGLQFFTPAGAVNMFERAGFKPVHTSQHAIVSFTLLHAV